jgi:hypothetical protein
MATLYSVPQNFSTTLNVGGGITSGATTGIVLTSVTGLPTDGGILCFDWAATLDISVAEYIEYTGITGNELTGVTRGAEGVSAKAHSNGCTVVGVLSQAHIKRIKEKLDGTDTSGVTLAAASFTTNDPSLATGLNIQVNGADPKRGIYVSASAMFPSTTAGCAGLTQVESSTNDVNIKVLDFDGAGTSKEYAEFGIPSPSYWDASTITATFYWYATAGSGTVNWEIQGLALADDDALDTAYGTLQEVTDTLLATGDVHASSETSAVTIAGTPVAGDWIQLRVARDPANDTNTSDARLMGVRIRFGISRYDDQ